MERALFLVVAVVLVGCVDGGGAGAGSEPVVIEGCSALEVEEAAANAGIISSGVCELGRVTPGPDCAVCSVNSIANEVVETALVSFRPVGECKFVVHEETSSKIPDGEPLAREIDRMDADCESAADSL